MQKLNCFLQFHGDAISSLWTSAAGIAKGSIFYKPSDSEWLAGCCIIQFSKKYIKKKYVLTDKPSFIFEYFSDAYTQCFLIFLIGQRPLLQHLLY